MKDKNELNIKKQSNNTKSYLFLKKFIPTYIVISLVLIVFAFIFINTNTESKNITSINGNPELARAMTYGELTDDDELTQSEYVRFSAFFLRDLDEDGYAEKVKGTCKALGESDTLYMSLNVLTEGTFKNGKIEIQSNNMYFQTALVDDEIIDGNYISDNTSEISLKDVNVGTQKLIFGEARSGSYSNVYNKTLAIGNDTTKYSDTNKIILTGIHVANDGTETEIRKEIELPVDWYNTPTAEIPYTYAKDKPNRYQSYNSSNIIDEANQEIELSFKIATQETKNLQILSKSCIIGEIPQLNGYDPLEVQITGKKVSYTYDADTRVFSAQREASLDLDGKVLSEAYSGSYETNRYNEYTVKVTYPLEAYLTLGIDTINLAIPVKGWYEGYNNPNEEFTNPVKSNVAESIISVVYEFGGGDVIGFDVKVGKYIPSPYNAWVVSKDSAERIYKNEDPYYETYDEEKYEVMWKVVRGADGVISNIKLREQDSNYTDKFLTTDNQYIDMEEFVDYVGIYFVGAEYMFGADGYIDVINDETDELIHRFTTEDWGLYSSSSPYEYDDSIKHIRIETSAANNSSSFYAYHIKRIDNEILANTFTQDEFNKLSLICSYLSANIKYIETDEYKAIKNDIDRANYDAVKSIVILSSITPNVYSTQETKENVQIVISTQMLAYNTVGWENGEFLLKFPEEILKLDVNSVSISNNGVTILGYSAEEKDDGFYLKILTENNYSTTYNLTIDCDITPDPRNLSVTKDVELYAINSAATSYLTEAQDIYDVDGDGNVSEYIAKGAKSITLVGPTSIITIETATEYNENHDELETSIAPQVAIIDKTQNEKTAKISASILNNYSGNISEIKLVGKIPFEGNTFQLLNEKELGSTYTAKMLGPITIPDEIKEYAKVYYSENEMVNEDLNDSTNNWIPESEMTDYSNVKTYLIDLEDYTMAKGEEQICTYKIEIPNDVDYNEVAYSTHAVYFSLETSEGKLRDKTETNKLGFMIARKYALEINKTKMGADTQIQGATFNIIEVGTENQKILSTNSEGKIVLTDLYVERDYIIKEIKAPYNYIKNDEEIRIRGSVVDGELVVEKITEEIVEDETTEDADTDEETETTEETEEQETIEVKEALTIVDGTYGKTVIVNVENEPKYTLRLTKYEKDTDNVIQGVQFQLYGKGMPNNGKYVTTNKDGQLTITGLYPGQTYWLYEVYAKGYTYDYYSTAFIANWNEENELEVEVTYGGFREGPTIDTTPEHQPIVDVSVDNTKLREYGLNLIKYEKDTNETLAGAKFNIYGTWLNEEIITDENGQINIDTLYEGKWYYINELLAPEGYTTSTNQISFKGTFNDDGELEITVYNGTLPSYTEDSWTEEGTVLNSSGEQITGKKVAVTQDENGKYIFKIGYENEPLFKLTKKDGTTYEPLENAKFAVFKLDSDNKPQVAKDIKGRTVGELESEYINITFDVKEDTESEEDTDEIPVYYWSQNIEGVWYSGNYNVDSSTSTLTSNEFTLTEPKLIAFDWAVSSESISLDYLYYTVTNVDTNKTIGGTSTKIGGTSQGTEYSYLNFESTGVYLEPGTYTISFTYYKDGSVSRGLDRGYVKNITSGYYLVSTDEFGKISLGLPEGTYQVVEIEAPEGYVLPENIEDRTYYMSIGKNKPEERSVEKVEEITFETNGNLTYVNEIATSDGGTLVAGTVTGIVTIDAENTVNGEDIVLTGTDGVLLKYNNDNKVEWAKKVYGSAVETAKKILEVNDGYMVAFEGTTIKIPAEQTVSGEAITLTTRNNDFIVIKYDFSGLVDWGVCSYGYTSDYIRDIDKTSDGGFIAVGYWNGTDINLLENKTASGEMISLVNKNSVSRNNALMIKYNSDNLVEWATAISGNGANYLNSVKEITNENGEIEYLCVADIGGAVIDEADVVDGTDLSYASGAYRGLLKFNSEGKINQFYDSFSAAPITYINEDNSVIAIQKNRVVGYDSSGEIIKNVSLDTLPFTFSNIEKCSDGGYIVTSLYSSNYTISASLTVSGESIALTNSGKNDFVIIKFTDSFQIESARMFGSAGDDSNIDIVELTNGQYNVIMKFAGTYQDGDNEFAGATLARFDDINTIVMSDNKLQETSYFWDAIKTSDNGKLGVGYYKGYQNLNVNGEDIILYAKGGYDAFLTKYNESNSIEWYISFGSGEEDKFTGVAEMNGNYLVSGIYYGNIEIDGQFTESGEAISLTNNSLTNYNSVILEINTDGKIVDYVNFDATANVKLDGLRTCTETEYYVYGSIYGSMALKDEEDTSITVASTGYDDGIIMKFNSENKLINYATLGSGGNSSEYFTSMTVTLDEGVALTGYINAAVTVTTKYGETITLTNSWQDMVVIKYDHELNVDWASHPGPQVSSRNTRSCAATDDGGVIVTGDLYYGKISFTAEQTVAGEEISLSRIKDAWCGFIIKYNSDGLVEWARTLGASGNIRSLRPIGYKNGAILLMSGDGGMMLSASVMQNGVQFYDSNWSSPNYVLKCNENGYIDYAKRIENVPMRGGVILDENEYLFYGGENVNSVQSAYIMTVNEYMVFAEVPVQQVIEVENTKMEFEITTDIIEDENGVKGGTISGEDETPYETVEYGEDATKEIIITPDEDYKILKIIINGEEIQFTPDEDESYTIRFEEIKEDKHVEVEFSSTVSDIIVHHYLEGTEESVADDEIFHGEIGTNYTTAPKMDLEEYEINIDLIPSNASGTYIEDTQIIIYYYEKRNATLTVHHYLEGTTEEISSEGYTKEYPKGESYTTSSATDLEGKYELVDEPANKEGVITEDTIVIYYYKIKTFVVTTKVEAHEVTDELGITTQVKGGSILGEGDSPYETVEYGEDTTKEIIAVPDEGYYVKSITVNGVSIEFTANEDKSVTLSKFVDMTEDKDVVVLFEADQGNVIVHHYQAIQKEDGTYEYTTTKVIDDEIKSGAIGSSYATKNSELVPEYYQYVSSTEPTSGKYTIEDQEVTYYYELKDYEYRIEYYYDGIIDDSKTESDIVIYGEIIDSYIDKNITGYRLQSTEEGIEAGIDGLIDGVVNLPLTVTEIEENNVIKVYYVKDQFEYTVEYYYDGTIDEDKTENLEATYQDVIDTYIDKNIAGYKLDKEENLPLTITEIKEDNVIKVYYVKDEFEYTVEYYYDNVIDDDKTETGKATYQGVINTYTDKNITGYKLDKEENLPLTITEIKENNVIKVYYVKDEFEYTVEYYYDDVIDNDKTENLSATYQDVISTYTDKNITGYKLDKEENLPLTITEIKEDNVIKIYYVIDDENVKTLSYTVEYYKDSVLQTDDTQIVEEIVQILQPNTLSVDKTQINTVDKYVGYKLDKLEPEAIPDIVNDGDIIKVYYVKDEFEYTVEYYYDGTIDEDKTENLKATYQDVINTYIDKNITGYKLDKEENLPLMITENKENNVIKVYYVKDEFEYTVEYYYDNVIDNDKTETGKATYQDVINTYEDKTEYGYKFEGVENLPLTITEIKENNVIKVYYVRKDSTVRVEYVEKTTGKEISEDVIKTGKVFDEYDVTEDEKEIEGYTLIEKPEPTTGNYTEEEQVKTYYYAVNTKVIVRYVEKGTLKELADIEEIIGYEGKEYKTEEKEIENYTYVESTENTEGTMTVKEIEVIYYYLQNTKATVNYIDKTTGEIIETRTEEGLVGDIFTTESKDFEDYVLVEEPIEKVVEMEKEEVVINYYYIHVSSGVLEKHIDVMTDEILYNELHAGNEGDEYNIVSKEFEGYDLVEERQPLNAKGKMTRELIEVRYYYIRKVTVKVEYIDINTGEIIIEEKEIDEDGDGIADDTVYENTTEYIYGHEKEEYETEEKEIDGYVIVEEKLPENAKGTMEVEQDEDGEIITEIVVKYYYVKIAGGVIEEHIDEQTEEILYTEKHAGNVGDEYSIESKEFEGYDLVEERLPLNAEGKMTEEEIVVRYYYKKKAKVVVEYIDKITGEKIEEKDEETGETKDSTEVIEGHEGDKYSTEEKQFEDYVIVEEEYPENKKGEMTVTEKEDGSIENTIYVKYYYVHVSGGVIENHIDEETGEKLATNTYTGNEGDRYKTTSKEIEGYDLVEERLPENAEGTMTKEVIEVNYYYKKKAKVVVEYIDKNTGEIIAQEEIEGYNGDEYETKEKTIEKYRIVEDEYPENTKGTMKDTIYVRYYYEREVKVIVEYINKETNEQFENSRETIEGYEGEEYSTEKKEFEGYEKVEVPENAKGTMKVTRKEDGTVEDTIYVRYYYSKEETPVEVPTQPVISTPSTGDMVPVIVISIIGLVVVVNIVQIVISKRKKK